MPSGSKPGERRGGRQKGTKNKRSVGVDEVVRKAVKSAVKDATSASDKVIERWETIFNQFMGQAVKEQQKGEGWNQAFFNQCLLNANRVLCSMAPYVRPRLSSVELKTPDLDLSRLTDAQLSAFYGLLAAASGNAAEGTRGDGAAPHQPGRLN